MTILRYADMPGVRFLEGAERRLGHTGNLMIVVVDFHDGPQLAPDPPHSHPHEQGSYLAAEEILFVMDGQQTRLRPGDMYLVPSGEPHSMQRLTEHVRLVDCFTPIRQDFLQ